MKIKYIKIHDDKNTWRNPYVKLESYKDLKHRDLCFIFLEYDKEYIGYIFINKML